MTPYTLAFLGLGGGELLLILLTLVTLGGFFVVVVAVAAYIVIRSLGKVDHPPVDKPQPAETTVLCGKHVSEHANLSGSQFHDVNLAGADFDNVNLSSARFHDVNLSNVSITAAQMGGAAFKHIGPPPGPDGRQERQRPVRFEEMMLCDSLFRKVDLSNARVSDCDLSGMTIDGILVSDLIAAYEKQQSAGEGGVPPTA